MAREIDTSKAVCDTCGKPYKPGDALYTVADKWEEVEEGHDVLISFRHWGCHTPIDVAFDKLRAKIDEAKDTLQKLKRGH